MSFDASKDSLILNEDALKDSELFTKICTLSGMNIEEVWDNIKMLAEEKSYQVEIARELRFFELLEAEQTVITHNKLLLLKNVI
jgi:hypothetical protein